VPQGKKILTRDTVDIGTAVAKACCIEHTDLTGFPPEKDWGLKQNSSMFAQS
jgi:hypothetical protein